MTQSYLRSAKVTPTLSPGGAGRGAQDIARRLRLGLRRIRLRSSSAFAATSRPGVQKPHCSAACSRKQNDAAALFEIYSMHNSYFRSDVNEPQLVKRAEARRSTSPGCPASQCAAENAHAKLEIIRHQFVKGFASAPVNLRRGGVDQVAVAIERAEKSFFIKSNTWLNPLQRIPIDKK
jgi:hypothetical protein